MTQIKSFRKTDGTLVAFEMKSPHRPQTKKTLEKRLRKINPRTKKQMPEKMKDYAREMWKDRKDREAQTKKLKKSTRKPKIRGNALANQMAMLSM